MADEDEKVESISFMLKSGQVVAINGKLAEEWLAGRKELPAPSAEAMEALTEFARVLARRAAEQDGERQ